MNENMPYAIRDISWLSFNYRVLQEAKDPKVPLFERIKFLAIYSNNLNEFFRVRVAHHRNVVRASKKAQKEIDTVMPKNILKKIHKIVDSQQEEFNDIFENEIIPLLNQNGIRLLRRMDLNEEQREFVETYFHDHLLSFVQPVLLVKKKIRPFLSNAALYLSILLQNKNKPQAAHQYAIVKIPSDFFPRFLELPSIEGHHDIIMLDDVVRHSVAWLFPGFDILDTYSFKLTRDAELYIDDEYSGDLIAKIKKSLTKRDVGPPSRFVYDQEMPDELLKFLMENFDLEAADLIKEGRYHNNFDFFQFPTFGMDHLKIKKLTTLPYPPLEKVKDIFEAIKERDHLIHVPYESYESVIRLFEIAAKDPKVTHIKIIQYRVARKSRIMNALIDAVKMGKQVTAFIEVKARFDEEANLKWGEKLEKAGVNVHYSFPGLKVHSKLALISREEDSKVKLYAYMSTGNFHEGTARVYSDFGFFTSNTSITSEAAGVFGFLETVQLPNTDFKHLLVGQFNLRSSLNEKIEREISNAKQGKIAKMILKMNSLEDMSMIEKLYEASNAGVKISLIIRGICCLIPNIKGYSENIEIISIVDRYLEHSRVFLFHNGGDEEIYLSSADFMKRNLSYRIETAFPIYDPILKKEIKDFLLLQLSDNVKARIIDAQDRNHYKKNDMALPIRSQIETYYRLKRKLESQSINQSELEKESTIQS